MFVLVPMLVLMPGLLLLLTCCDDGGAAKPRGGALGAAADAPAKATALDAMFRREHAGKFHCCAGTCSMASRCDSQTASLSDAQSDAAIVKFCMI